jgi:hypothetical protein
MKAIIQDLNLSVGERAICTAGYPSKSTVIIECIKDFDTAKNSDEIVNNPHDFIKVVNKGKFGLTSHIISSNWQIM